MLFEKKMVVTPKNPTTIVDSAIMFFFFTLKQRINAILKTSMTRKSVTVLFKSQSLAKNLIRSFLLFIDLTSELKASSLQQLSLGGKLKLLKFFVTSARCLIVFAT